MRHFIFALLTFVACTRGHSPLRIPTATCPRTPPPDAVPYDTAQWRAVAGRFRMFHYDTINRPDWNPGGHLIELQPVDSAYEAELRSRDAARLRVFRNARPSPIPRLVGIERVDATVRVDPNLVFYVETLVDGCDRDCHDSSPTFYSFTTTTANGYRGQWVNNMTGIAVMTDPKSGRRLPAPAGYFCAIRQ